MHFVATFMSGKSKARGNVFKFRFARLTEFTSNNEANSKKPVRRKVDPQQRRLPYFDIPCPYCGACGGDWITRRGSRDNERKGLVQRYGCKKCGRRFSRESWGHFPLWVVEAILSLAVAGLGPSEIVAKLKEEASRHNQTVRISRQTVSNIIKRCVQTFLRFEEHARRKCTSSEWQIDDSPQPFTRRFKPSSEQHKDSNRDFWWITNVIDGNSWYWLASYVSWERDAKVSEKAVRMAIKRARDAPNRWRSDGLRAHIRGIKNVLPNAVIFSKTKAEKFEHINLIESLHSSMRRKGIKKRKKFHSLMTLQILLDLVRMWHNFLRQLDSLGEITPAAKVGIVPVFKSWGEFIRYVYRHSR